MGSVLVLLAIIGGALLLAVGVYNGLVSKRMATRNGWSQIAVQLKRRHDLIPNLVETVKGYASHEKDTLERTIAARNAAVSKQDQGDIKGLSSAEGALSGMLRQVFALSESYPDLKANQNFLQLQEEIASTENKIGFARQHYNDTVEIYNTAIQQVPGNLVAGFGGFQAAEFFELSEEEKKAAEAPPKVSFS